MNETKITGGKVSYGKTVAPQQFFSNRADVEVTFIVAEGDGEGLILEKCMATAMRRVYEMLNIPLPAPQTTSKPPLPAEIPSSKASSGLFG